MNNHDGQRRHREELIQTHASRGYRKDETAWLKIIVVPVEVDIWGGHMWWVYNQQITGMVSIYTLCHLLEEMKRESLAQLRARCAYISLLSDKNNGKFLDSMVTESGTSSSSSLQSTAHTRDCSLQCMSFIHWQQNANFVNILESSQFYGNSVCFWDMIFSNFWHHAVVFSVLS